LGAAFFVERCQSFAKIVARESDRLRESFGIEKGFERRGGPMA
jgi:hypothetical protein